MDFYKEILAHALAFGEVKIVFPGEAMDIAQIVEGECYKTLRKIKTIIDDDSLEDRECFIKIEEIISAFEEIGSYCGGRHDFS